MSLSPLSKIAESMRRLKEHEFLRDHALRMGRSGSARAQEKIIERINATPIPVHYARRFENRRVTDRFRRRHAERFPGRARGRFTRPERFRARTRSSERFRARTGSIKELLTEAQKAEVERTIQNINKILRETFGVNREVNPLRAGAGPLKEWKTFKPLELCELFEFLISEPKKATHKWEFFNDLTYDGHAGQLRELEKKKEP